MSVGKGPPVLGTLLEGKGDDVCVSLGLVGGEGEAVPVLDSVMDGKGVNDGVSVVEAVVEDVGEGVAEGTAWQALVHVSQPAAAPMPTPPAQSTATSHDSYAASTLPSPHQDAFPRTSTQIGEHSVHVSTP